MSEIFTERIKKAPAEALRDFCNAVLEASGCVPDMTAEEALAEDPPSVLARVVESNFKHELPPAPFSVKSFGAKLQAQVKRAFSFVSDSTEPIAKFREGMFRWLSAFSLCLARPIRVAATLVGFCLEDVLAGVKEKVVKQLDSAAKQRKANASGISALKSAAGSLTAAMGLIEKDVLVLRCRDVDPLLREFCVAQMGSLSCKYPATLSGKAWLVCISQTLCDRLPAVRLAAVRVLRKMYREVPSRSVLSQLNDFNKEQYMKLPLDRDIGVACEAVALFGQVAKTSLFSEDELNAFFRLALDANPQVRYAVFGVAADLAFDELPAHDGGSNGTGVTGDRGSTGGGSSKTREDGGSADVALAKRQLDCFRKFVQDYLDLPSSAECLVTALWEQELGRALHNYGAFAELLEGGAGGEYVPLDYKTVADLLVQSARVAAGVTQPIRASRKKPAVDLAEARRGFTTVFAGRLHKLLDKFADSDDVLESLAELPRYVDWEILDRRANGGKVEKLVRTLLGLVSRSVRPEVIGRCAQSLYALAASESPFSPSAAAALRQGVEGIALVPAKRGGLFLPLTRLYALSSKVPSGGSLGAVWKVVGERAFALSDKELELCLKICYTDLLFTIKGEKDSGADACGAGTAARATDFELFCVVALDRNDKYRRTADAAYPCALDILLLCRRSLDACAKDVAAAAERYISGRIVEHVEARDGAAADDGDEVGEELLLRVVRTARRFLRVGVLPRIVVGDMLSLYSPRTPALNDLVRGALLELRAEDPQEEGRVVAIALTSMLDSDGAGLAPLSRWVASTYMALLSRDQSAKAACAKSLAALITYTVQWVLEREDAVPRRARVLTLSTHYFAARLRPDEADACLRIFDDKTGRFPTVMDIAEFRFFRELLGAVKQGKKAKDVVEAYARRRAEQPDGAERESDPIEEYPPHDGSTDAAEGRSTSDESLRKTAGEADGASRRHSGESASAESGSEERQQADGEGSTDAAASEASDTEQEGADGESPLNLGGEAAAGSGAKGAARQARGRVKASSADGLRVGGGEAHKRRKASEADELDARAAPRKKQRKASVANGLRLAYDE